MIIAGGDYGLGGELADRTVDVWAVRLAAPDPLVARFHSLLAPDERERAGRFAFDHLRRSFTLARGALRILLGRYLDSDPAGIRFAFGEKGKPSVAEKTRIKFNASHSGDLALYAVTLDCEIGVDIERVRALPELAEIAARYFSAEERADLMRVPEEQRETAFFRCWTRKEAYVKGTGDGLSAIDTIVAADWTVQDLETVSGYAAAFAYRGATRAVRQAPAMEAAELFVKTNTGTNGTFPISL